MGHSLAIPALKTVFREHEFRTLRVYTTMQADIHSPRAYTRHNRPPPAPKTPRSAPVGEIFIPARGSVVIAAWYKSAVRGPRSPPVRILAAGILFPPRAGPPRSNPRPHMATGRWKWWRGVIQHQMYTFVKMHPLLPQIALPIGSSLSTRWPAGRENLCYCMQ